MNDVAATNWVTTRHRTGALTDRQTDGLTEVRVVHTGGHGLNPIKGHIYTLHNHSAFVFSSSTHKGLPLVLRVVLGEV